VRILAIINDVIREVKEMEEMGLITRDQAKSISGKLLEVQQECAKLLGKLTTLLDLVESLAKELRAESIRSNPIAIKLLSMIGTEKDLDKLLVEIPENSKSIYLEQLVKLFLNDLVYFSTKEVDGVLKVVVKRRP